MVHQLDMLKQKHANQLQEKKAEYELQREHQRAIHETDIQFYQQLKDIGTDITQVMVAQNRNPDKLIQIVNEPDEKTRKTSSPAIRFVNQI